MERVLEPELMDDREQAEAYASADFEESHRGIVEAFDTCFPGVEVTGPILDLGCGPGDITFRFASRFPESSVLGLDGSSVMLELAEARRTHETSLSDRVRFIEGLLPEAPIPTAAYAAIVSNSLLHHLHRPGALWEVVSRHASRGTRIFIADLVRPSSRDEARRIVSEAAAGEPEVLKRDFYNSLLAAFEPGEVEAQLAAAGLDELRVRMIDRLHMAAFGKKG